MEPGKDRCSIARTLGLRTFRWFLNVHEARENIEPRVALPDILPEIRRAMSRRRGRIAGPTSLPCSTCSLIEWKKTSFGSLELGCHGHKIGIDHKVHDGAACQRQVIRITINSILLYRVFERLIGQLIF